MAREKDTSNPNSYEVYAEIEERFTEDKANATAEFSVHDALYKTLTIKPISYTVEGDTDYGFFVSYELCSYHQGKQQHFNSLHAGQYFQVFVVIADFFQN